MSKVEQYYDGHKNPYHNSIHGADVAQTLNCFIMNTGMVVSGWVWPRGGVLACLGVSITEHR